MSETPPKKVTISAQFETLVEDTSIERISLADMMEHFGRRSYGLIMLALALPNMIPIYIPGLSVICGLPIMILGYQLARQQPHPTLPKFLMTKSFARSDLNRVFVRAVPALQRVEAVLKPRWGHMTTPSVETAVGLAAMTLSLFMLLPLPMTNIGPAIGIAVLSLGLVEEDGLFIAIGAAVSSLAVFITIGIIGIYMSGVSAGFTYFFAS